ncbi:MAG TPA: hypothetical protein QGH92_00125, partial [Candidatus Parcubacteria bacterium]|nr:hypothetical protein [Candidatus Parcubacteria bacterium]
MKIKLLLLIFALTLLAGISITISVQAFVTSGSCPEGSIEVSCVYPVGPTCCEWDPIEEEPPLGEEPP